MTSAMSSSRYPAAGRDSVWCSLEAMAHGKPVVGGAQRRHSGDCRRWSQRISGSSHGDVAQLTERLGRLLADESLRRRMGVKALNAVRRDYLFGELPF